MTDPTLEANVERLLRRCVPRISPDQVERSLARAKRRQEEPGRRRALPVALAAAAALAIAGWLVLSSKPGADGPAPAQEPARTASAQEIDRLINDLGGAAPERKAAEDRLRAIGRPALEALDKALYHENPDVRIPARDLARLIRSDASAKAALEKAQAESAPIREAVRRVRERWTARDFTDLEEVVREAFRPAKIVVVHYVPKKLIGTEFKLGKPNEDGSLSRELANALDQGDGVAFVRKPDHAVIAYGPSVLFTLPDKKGWSAYVYAEFMAAPRTVDRRGKPYAPESYTTRLLASSEARQVWGVDPDEIDWADQNFDAIVDSDIQVSRATGGGLKIERVTPSTVAALRGLQAGDVVKDVNGQLMNSLEDVRKIFGSMKGQSGLRINLERSGKPLILEYRPLAR